MAQNKLVFSGKDAGFSNTVPLIFYTAVVTGWSVTIEAASIDTTRLNQWFRRRVHGVINWSGTLTVLPASESALPFRARGYGVGYKPFQVEFNMGSEVVAGIPGGGLPHLFRGHILVTSTTASVAVGDDPSSIEYAFDGYGPLEGFEGMEGLTWGQVQAEVASLESVQP